MVAARGLGPRGRKLVWVRLPPPVLLRIHMLETLWRIERRYLEQRILKVSTTHEDFYMPKSVAVFFMGRDVMEYGKRPMLLHRYFRDFRYCWEAVRNSDPYFARLMRKLNMLARKIKTYIFETEDMLR